MRRYFTWLLGVCPYFGMLLVFLGMFLFHANYVCLLALVSFLVLCPVSIVSANYFEKKVSIRCVVNAKQVEKNQSFEVKIVAENFSFAVVSNLKVELKLHHSVTGKTCWQEISVPAPWKGVSTVLVTVSSPFCGRIEISVEEVEITSILSLVRVTREVKARKEVLVMPELVDLELSELCGEIIHGLNLEDGVVGVREYTVGDSWQKMHWKLTAKKSELLVKEFERVGEETMSIVLKCYRGDFFSINDDVLELYLSTVKALLQIQHKCIDCFVEAEDGTWYLLVRRIDNIEIVIKELFYQAEKIETEKEEGRVLYVCAKEEMEAGKDLLSERGKAVVLWQ